MISKLSERIAVGLKRAYVIEEKDIDLYSYGFFVLLSRMSFLVLTLLFGILMNITVESILFYFLFVLLRAYAGGVHASKEWMCLCFTSMAMLLSALGIKLLIQIDSIVVPLIITIISSAIVLVLSPLDTKEKPLTNDERKKYKEITIVIVTLYLVGVFGFLITGLNQLAYSIESAVILESFLLLLGHIKRISDSKVESIKDY